MFSFLVDCDGFSSLLGFVSLSFLLLALVSWETVSRLSLVTLVSISHIGGERVALNVCTVTLTVVILKVW